MAIPLALRAQQLREEWRAWNTAAAANATLAARAMAAGRGGAGSPP